MLKMNKKKVSKETVEEKNEVLKEEENKQTDKESEEKKDETTIVSEKTDEVKEEKKELTLEEKYADLNDRFLRLHAEFDNYRKRTIKERIELSRTASEDAIRSFLPVLDDLERAIKSMEDIPGIESAKEGVNLIHCKFKNILTQKGVEEIKTTGEDFNTDFHEALSSIPAENEEQKGKIVDFVEKGYMLNGKVIRFAKVIVGN